MKSIFKIAIILMVFATIVACKKDSRPNYQFMPNMYEPVPYEAYEEVSIVVDGNELLENDMEAQMPVIGTIPRGDFLPFEIENTNEGYEYAKTYLVSPLDSMQVNTEKGKELYDIYCGICHGNKGKGQGKLVKREKILGVPSYDDAGRAITAGSIYHTIYYGKNAMGSYANQLNEEERWQVVDYVLKLKADLEN